MQAFTSENKNRETKPFFKKTWFKVALIVAILAIGINTIFLIIGSDREGPIMTPTATFLEQIILEMILHVGDVPYFLGPLYIVLASTFGGLLYGGIVGFIVWLYGKSKKWFVFATTCTLIVISFSMYHITQKAFFEFQCDPDMALYAEGLINRSCQSPSISEVRVGSQFLGSYARKFDVFSEQEIMELGKNLGDFGYLCNSECYVSNFQCEVQRSSICIDCINKCSEIVYPEGPVAQGIGFLSSKPFRDCIYTCNP